LLPVPINTELFSVRGHEDLQILAKKGDDLFVEPFQGKYSSPGLHKPTNQRWRSQELNGLRVNQLKVEMNIRSEKWV
jgi:hypothetical protein